MTTFLAYGHWLYPSSYLGQEENNVYKKKQKNKQKKQTVSNSVLINFMHFAKTKKITALDSIYEKVINCFKEIWDRKGKLDVNQLHTIAHMTSLAACQCVLAASSTRMDRHGFSDDQAILNQFSDLLACSINIIQYTQDDEQE